MIHDFVHMKIRILSVLSYNNDARFMRLHGRFRNHDVFHWKEKQWLTLVSRFYWQFKLGTSAFRRIIVLIFLVLVVVMLLDAFVVLVALMILLPLSSNIPVTPADEESFKDSFTSPKSFISVL